MPLRAVRCRRGIGPRAGLPDAPAVPALAGLARIEAEHLRQDGKIKTAIRYIALSKRLSPSRVLDVTRAHWSVENDLHWQPDVVFLEDNVRTRKNYGPQNLAVIQRIALDVAYPSYGSVHRQKNETRRVEQRVLLRTLCS